MRWAALLVGAAFFAEAHEAAAEPTSAFGFEVEAAKEAATCADRDVLAARIAERLGRDPFTREAHPRGRLRVRFGRRTARTWSAEIELADANDERVGGRSLSHEGAQCEPLASSVVLTIAVLLEELVPPAPASAPTTATPEPPPPSQPPSPLEWPPEPPPPAPPPSPQRVRIDVAIGGAALLGGAPAATAGGELGLGLDVGRLRLELGGRFYAPASTDGDVGLRSRLVHGRFAPCWGIPLVSGCLVAAVGSVSGEAVGARVIASRLDSQLYAGGGVGIVSRVFVVRDWLFLRSSVEVLFAAARAGFDVGDTRIWTVPLASAAGAIALGFRFP